MPKTLAFLDSCERWLPKRLFARTSLVSLLPVLALLLLIGIWSATLLQIGSEYTRSRDETFRQNDNLVRTFEEHVLRTIHAVDQSVLFLKYAYESEGGRIDLRSYVDKGIIQKQLFVQLAIVGPDGRLLKSSLPDFKPVDLSDREHIRVHVARDSGQLFISKPVKGKASGKWSIQFTRRINKPDGSFGGVVVISVDPFYFTDFYSNVDIGKSGVVTLVGADGIVRARTGSGLGQSIRAGRLFHYWPNAKSGHYVHTSLIDGITRFYSYRAVPGYPIAVVMGVSEDEALADYTLRRNIYLTVASLLSVLVVGTGAVLVMLAARLKLSQVRAESANKMKSEFLAHMSHELRTPLNGILGGAEYLEMSLEDPLDRDSAGMIRKSGLHLLNLVNDILDLARIEAGHMPLQVAPAHLPTLLHDAVELFRSEAVRKGLELSFACRMPDDSDGRYGVDSIKLVQIVNNLINNALKFTREGRIEVAAHVRENTLSLAVADTGCGIPRSFYPHVFERFHQAEDFLTRTYHGSGLGLALVKELVQIMGGQIHFDSEEGRGTTFVATLPLNKYEAA